MSFKIAATLLLLLLLVNNQVHGFQGPTRSKRRSSFLLQKKNKKKFLGNQLLLKKNNRYECNIIPSDPKSQLPVQKPLDSNPLESSSPPNNSILPPWILFSTIAYFSSFVAVDDAVAEISMKFGDMSKMTPQTFQPVCPASDNLYRFLQITTESVVGRDNAVEYSPLIAGGLLRIRLELCVVESFFNEAVGPFIRLNGLSWVLPLHETVETFLAGTIFALATTFILVGSTKLVTIIVTYADFFLGVPCRSLGGFAFDRALGKPVTLDIGFSFFKTRIIGPKDEDIEEEQKSKKAAKAGGEGTIDLGDNPVLTIVTGGVKSVGEASRIVREIIEAIDLFVGRYLVLYASGYIALKFLHFKIFPNFP